MTKELDKVRVKVQAISWADFAMGVDAVLNLLGKVKAGVVCRL